MMNHSNAPKQVGIWIRVSTEDQALSDSPQHHEQRARYYAESKGWNVAEVYHLEGVSGKSVKDHPETQRMLQDIQKGHITGLIFSKLARLARNTKELLEFSDSFQNCGADLVSLHESIDTSTPAGRLFYTMIAAMAEWEREEIASRVRASVPIRAKLGKSTGGSAMFGYQWKDQKLIPDPAEAPILQHIYELFLEHKRKKTVANILHQEGHRTRAGKRFSDTTIQRLLRDTTPKGMHRANYTTGDKRKIKAEEEWIYHPVEAVVSEEVWNQVNAILDSQMKTKKKQARRPVHLFAGMAFCSCGEPMYVPSNSPKYVCRACRNKIPIEDLEAIYHEQLKSFFFSPEEVSKYLHSADTTISEKQSQLTLLQAQQKNLQADIDKLFDLYLSGEIPKQGFRLRHTPLQEQLDQIQKRLPELQGEIDFLKSEFMNKDHIIASAQDLYARWPHLEHEEKRKILETITSKITIGKEDIEIDLCYLPSFELVSKGQHTPEVVQCSYST